MPPNLVRPNVHRNGLISSVFFIYFQYSTPIFICKFIYRIWMELFEMAKMHSTVAHKQCAKWYLLSFKWITKINVTFEWQKRVLSTIYEAQKTLSAYATKDQAPRHTWTIKYELKDDNKLHLALILGILCRMSFE